MHCREIRRTASTIRRMSGAGAALPSHGALLSFLIFFFFLSCGTVLLCRGREDAGVKCTERERAALLAVGADIWDAEKRLRLSSSWGWEGREDDCCRWVGVGCDRQSGHVVKLDLGWPDHGVSYDYYWRRDHQSKVNPALLNLTSLKHLDLSNIDFGGAQIPDFIGSLANLEYLNLSRARFSGHVPPQLGRLRNLRSLDLRGLYFVEEVENLHWLSPLSRLRYLDMSGVYLSKAIEWLHVVSSLPLLSVLRLSRCGLPNLPTRATLPVLQVANFSTSLSTLDLSENYFNSAWPLWLFNVTSLRELDLSYNYYLHGPIPDGFGNNLKQLQVLSLWGSNFEGVIPGSLWTLDQLKVLSLSGHNLQIRLPEHFEKLHNLRKLELGGVVGRIPASLGNLNRLESLGLSRMNIRRGLLRAMGRLCNLARLSISGNMARGAEVNELFEGLSQCTVGSRLELLDLQGNGFGGHLPDQLGQLKDLEYLDLGGNSILGSIPTSVGELTSLTTLILSDNRLCGPVPRGIGELFNLRSLNISSNALEGVLSEAHFANLSALRELDMSYNAALSLTTNWAWIPPFQLSIFRMSGCQVGPDFPRWLQTQKTLLELNLSSNVLSQSLPDDFFDSFSHTLGLNLSHNLTSGPISISTNNDFNLEYLDLSRNSISGSIPLSICQMKNLQILDLSYNSLTGEIPGCWENTSLHVMKLSQNMLSWPIPSSPRMLSQLTSLHLDRNSLVGVISSFLKYSTQLVMLDLAENHLSGAIPTWLGESLSSLQVLRLRSNMLHGSIPTSLSQLQSLQILDLACNNLSGNLLLSFHNFSAMVKMENPSYYVMGPTSVVAESPTASLFKESIRIVPKGSELEYTTTLTLVTIIDLSNNSLRGHIPEEITDLTGLHFLILSRNHLEGRIPTSISRMRLLESLDLSFNLLTGSIPVGVSTLSFLVRFNVSFNNLFGRIPPGSQLQTFDQSSYVGNPGLCGSPSLRPCPDDVPSKDLAFQPSAKHVDKHEPYKVWFYIGMGTGFAVGFWGFFGMLLVMENKRVMYFRLIDFVADELYVMIVIHYARLKLKISSWVHGKPMN